MADAATVSVLIQAKDNASREFKNVESNMGKMVQGIQQHRRAIGMAMTAMGAAITGIAALSVQSAFDQEKGIRQLDVALQKVGTSYEQQKAQIEAVVAAQQNKTNFGDEEQRDALRELILVSGNYDDAMKALVPTMELAAGKEMDLGAAATLVARAISGEESALNRYGVSVEKGADSTEVLSAIMAKFQGQAEAAADPMTQLKNRVGDLFQAMGTALLPVIETMVPLIESMVKRMIEWTEAHPNLTKVLSIVAASLGAIMLVLGPMLLILPQLFMGMKIFAGGIRLVTAAMAANPVGILLVALTTLAMVALPLVMKNWDKIFNGIKKVTETVVNFVIGILNKLTLVWRKQFELIGSAVAKLLELGSKLPFVGDKFKGAADAIKGFSDKLGDGIPMIDITADRQEELQDTMNSTANVSEDVGFQVSNQQQKIARSAEDMALDFSTAYGDVEDASMQAQGITIQSLEEIEAKQKEFSDRVAFFAQKNKEAEIQARQESRDDYLKWIEDGLAAAQRRRDEEARITEQINDSWTRYKVNQDVTMQALAKANLDFADVVEGLAQRHGVSASKMADDLARAGVRYGDTMGLIKQAGRTAVDGVIGDFSRMEEAARISALSSTDFLAEVLNHNERLAQESAARVQRARSGGVIGPAPQHAGMTRQAFARGQMEAAMKFGNVRIGAGVIAAAGLANGGIVQQPTLAVVGEAGPEAVVPLSKGAGMGTTNNFHFHGSVYGVEDLKEAVVEAVRDHAISGGFSGVFAEA
jgi:hypothetical protein